MISDMGILGNCLCSVFFPCCLGVGGNKNLMLVNDN